MSHLVMLGHVESGSCPWIYWNDILYVGRNRESHWDLIRGLVPDDLATITFMDDEGVIAGRAHLHMGEVRNYNIYKEDRVPADKKRVLAKMFEGTMWSHEDE